MRLLSELVGALGAGALLFVLARQAGLQGRRAVGAVALVPIALAAIVAVPGLRDGGAVLLDKREADSALSAEEAALQPGTALGANVDFLTWVQGQLAAEDTYSVLIGNATGGQLTVPQALTLQWVAYQLAPSLLVDVPDPAAAGGPAPDWLVFYESDPARYPQTRLGKVATYAPGFAIARSRDAN